MTQHPIVTTRIDDNATLIDPAWYQDDQPGLAQLAHKDQVYRIGLFRDWLEATGGSWLSADLTAYRNYLLHEYAQTRSKRTTIGLAPATVAAHLSTIRGRYQALLQSNSLRDRLYVSLTSAEDAPANRKAVVDELLIGLQNAVHPTTAPVMVDGDLRRTYARRLYEAGMDIERIRQNLGHASSQTILEIRKPMTQKQRAEISAPVVT